ncbi:uncharacterized protein EDB91DRAFT_1248103 [Suillus paluster]|uniref:uncharacterized protein n=1 Tax=Suillus paluster TaxID=48578 RepID=UPI001B8700A9|nr:uncharacterized protein EDB91DRAFT_1248103 [Suillus paluster]KAG1741556.1 hypothetical protein EDB91DRAFT_1248103 [Suillus paluster]
MSGQGSVIGKLEKSWDELLDHDNEPFDLSLPPFEDFCPSLTLKVTLVHPCGHDDSVLLNPIIESEIARCTDAGHTRLSKYMKSTSGVSHLNDAVNYFQWVLAQCPVGHPDRAAAVTDLAWARLQGYISKDLQYIDSIISLFRNALALPLNWCYINEGIVIDIHESAQLCCELLPLCPGGTSLRSVGVDTAINCVVRKCNKLPVDSYDEGIHIGRIVLKLCPLGYKHRRSALDNLSWGLCVRFQRSGSIVDIDESICLRRETVSLCSEGHPSRGDYLNDLAYSLACRFSQQHNFHDLNEAISLYEDALRLPCHAGYEYHGVALDNLGTTLLDRFQAYHDIHDINKAISLHCEALTFNRYGDLQAEEDLNEAIHLYRESLKLKQSVNSRRHLTLASFGSALCFRFIRTQNNEHIEELVDLCTETLEDLPALHQKQMVLLRLAMGRLFVSLPVENFRLASTHTQGFPYYRMRTALDRVNQAEKYQHESALEAYHTCLNIFDHYAIAQPSIIARRNAITAFHGSQSLPVNAASCAIRCHDLQRAIELEEWGRGHLPLAQKLLALSECLSDAQGSVVNTDLATTATEYKILMTQWEAALAETRNLDDFSRFLLPPSYEDLQAAARHGPVIILITSIYSCDAIIVPTSGKPCHVPFPFALVDLEMLKNDFAREMRQTALMGPTEPRTELRVLLRRADPSEREPCLEDIYICSYTPTLSALIRAQQTMKADPKASFVAIGQGVPGAGQCKPLNVVDSELELEATQGGALEALRHNTWVHLACHGKQDHNQPYYSHFAMRDKPLTLLDIMENDAPQAEFAFLSACHTAVGDEQTPDEVVHLAADAVAKHVVEAFYENMFKDLKDGVMDCAKAASALNAAMYAVKKKVPLE